MNPRGGAVAVWASSGQTLPGGQWTVNQEMYRQMFSAPQVRIGDAARAAKVATTDVDGAADVDPVWRSDYEAEVVGWTFHIVCRYFGSNFRTAPLNPTAHPVRLLMKHTSINLAGIGEPISLQLSPASGVYSMAPASPTAHP